MHKQTRGPRAEQLWTLGRLNTSFPRFSESSIKLTESWEGVEGGLLFDFWQTLNKDGWFAFQWCRRVFILKKLQCMIWLFLNRKMPRHDCNFVARKHVSEAGRMNIILFPTWLVCCWLRRTVVSVKPICYFFQRRPLTLLALDGNQWMKRCMIFGAIAVAPSLTTWVHWTCEKTTPPTESNYMPCQ